MKITYLGLKSDLKEILSEEFDKNEENLYVFENSSSFFEIKREYLKTYQNIFNNFKLLNSYDFYEKLFETDKIVIKEEKQVVLFYNSLNNSIKKNLKIKNYYDAIDIAYNFYALFSEMQEYKVDYSDKEKIGLEKWQKKTFDTLIKINKNIEKKVQEKGLILPYMLRRKENISDAFIKKYKKICFINKVKFTPFEEEMIEILEKVVHFSDIMNGEYDITIMPLIKLWGFYKKSDVRIPEKEEIDEIRKLIDYKKIIIDRERKRVKIDAGQEIITGSFIKSYAVDKLVKEMKRRGIDDAIVNAGGSSIVAVNQMPEDEWIIGVENPEKENISEKNEQGYVTHILLDSYREKNDEDLFDIKISDESYCTSNQGNTFVEIDNQKYGHILSPKTGYPGKNIQIGIVTKEAFAGDIISTGLYNQSPEKFFEILDRLNREIKVEGYMIDEEGKIHYSKGFFKHIVK